MENQLINERDWLILGHPRGGTTYMADLFRQNGILIGHEYMEKNGTSNWQFAISAEEYPYTFESKRQDYTFKKIVHVMRDPLRCISTIINVESASESFRAKYINIFGNVYEKAVLSYLGWHKLILSQKPDISIKLENAKEHFMFTNDSVKKNSTSTNYLSESELISKLNSDIQMVYLEAKTLYNSL